MKNKFSLVATTALIVATVLGCSGSGAECVGTVQYQGKTFEGKDKTADQAKHNACNNLL